MKYVLLLLLSLNLFSSFSEAKVVLQPHQKSPVEYLMNHPEQKGMLLFHSMGSGKTYIAIDYAEKNPQKKVVLFLPEFLKSNWITQMKSFGVKDFSRYVMISYDQPEDLLRLDLSKSILIVDEVHKLVQKLRTSFGPMSEKQILAYEKIKSADKILLLTGTPIFSETSDISYIANLLSKDDPYPIDSIKFKTEFMRIKPVTSLVRGQVTESKIMQLGVPFVIMMTAVVTVGTAIPWAVPIVALGGGAVIPVANEIFPAGQVAFREFDTEKWKDFSEKYISYYNVKLAENENYPNKKVTEKKVFYNDDQADLFLSFIDEDLNLSQLRMMLEEGDQYSDSYLRFHSERLQKQLLANTAVGLEIGNLDFINESGSQIESPKFYEILKIIQQSPGQVAVYSNYFKNGIDRFAKFLDRHGLKESYILLSPDQTVPEQMARLEQYNQGSKRILLIHPVITEGISLVGTEQFHILEPIGNAALREQIIGRAIRYKSHAHLPKERRLVNVYLWESDINFSNLGVPTSAGYIKREHWQKKYAEINPNTWSKGILEVDRNYFKKDETPDQRHKRYSEEIQKDLQSFQELLQTHSIESKYGLNQ